VGSEVRVRNEVLFIVWETEGKEKRLRKEEEKKVYQEKKGENQGGSLG